MSGGTGAHNAEREFLLVAGPPPAHALLRFPDPVSGFAVAAGTFSDAEADTDVLRLAVYPWGEAPETYSAWSARVSTTAGAPPVYVKSRGVEVWWCPGQAVLQCDAEERDALMAALMEFEWYSQALGGLEDEVAAGWGALQRDQLLAFDVTAADLRHSRFVGERMAGAFQRRIHFARVEPHLYAAGSGLTAAAQKLGNDLREKALMEDRAEALDAHLEVYEHIYEMAAQRTGEFRAAHQGHRVEWIIIWLLVAEVTLSLLQTLLRR